LTHTPITDDARLAQRARPAGFPIMRQHWGKLLFMHWRMEPKFLRAVIPFPLELDTFDGAAWIGVVPFTMWGVRATFLPPLPGTSAFHELNVRTYVHHRGVPSVWFLSLDAANKLAVWGARQFYHLPYFNARMSLAQTGNTIRYDSSRQDSRGAAAELETSWTIGGSIAGRRPALPGSLEFFLTERYALDTVHHDKLYRARIHHRPWPLQTAQLLSLHSTMVESHGLPAPAGDPLLHYCEELQVDIWPLRRVDV